MAKRRQIAYLFDEGSDDTASPMVRGGKGAGLAEMARLGMPIPPGFTLSTTLARAFAECGKLPDRLFHQLERGIQALEERTGKKFGSIDCVPDNPLLLSVRSGAPASMPGMMDTVLNLGLTSDIVEQLVQTTGNPRFVYDSYRRLLATMGGGVLDAVERRHFEDLLKFAKEQAEAHEDRQLSAELLKELCDMYFELIEENVGLVVIENPRKQLLYALYAVLGSWNSVRAEVYRHSQSIPDWWGTAVNIQAMVFGNLNDRSATGVVFSRNVATGAPGLYGEFMVQAQGEDLVSGIRTPQSIAEMADWNPEIFRKLEILVQKLENHFGHVVDVEFTVEDGRLFLLQCRKAKMAAQAVAVVAVHYVWENRHEKKEAVEMVRPAEVRLLSQASTFDAETVQKFFDHGSAVRGLPASPGVAVGRAVFTSEEAIRRAGEGEKVVLIRPDTSPDDLPGMLRAVAIITYVGGETSHAAVVARELNKPCVVSAGEIDVREGDMVSVDGTAGVVILGGVFTRRRTVRQKEIEIFLRWFKKIHPRSLTAPRIDFEWFTKQTCVNTHLNDFYLAGAMARNAAGSPLAGEALALKEQVHQETAELLACYLTVAVAGEIRHTDRRWQDTAEYAKILLDDYGVLLGGGDRHKSHASSVEKMSQMDFDRHLEFFRIAVDVFDNKNHWNGSIGGKRWADIARAGLGFLDGTLNHTVFADHAFDLRHNGGVLFNKNPMTSKMTNEALLKRQLDVKKSTIDISELHWGLSNIHNQFSPAVMELWQEGIRRGAWKEKKVG